jgi:phenylalanine-4-hydroxylase
MRTNYIIDDFQKTYFVIDSFEQLREDCYRDFGGIYDELEDSSGIEPHEIVPEDDVLTRGTLRYFREKA